MNYILEDLEESEYKIYFIHQMDNRPFNRGALKNIGFIVSKQLHINYKNITFIFNDIDTVPYKKNIINYETYENTINHFYGFEFALGGIFSIKGCDFEKINGFPNFWSWGFEDNCIYNRALKHDLIINRNNFFKIGDNNILQLFDGALRDISVNNIPRVKKDTGGDGIRTIENLNYYILDNIINVNTFNVPLNHNREIIKSHDIRDGNKVSVDGLLNRSRKNIYPMLKIPTIKNKGPINNNIKFLM
tara:strand:+ start:251 stop:988 length:738 start_codon:yes stop_codon:yes gene_type:complete